MSEGTVKWFNAQREYGFIHSGDGSKDVFVNTPVVKRAGPRMTRLSKDTIRLVNLSTKVLSSTSGNARLT